MSESPGPDLLLGGRLTLHQPVTGHRAGTDAVLLAAAADLEPGGVFIDVGAGVGTVGLAIATRYAESPGVLLELDPSNAALARVNVAANGMDGRMTVTVGNVFDGGILRDLAGKASLVVTNPPFFQAREVRASPDGRRAIAHVLGSAEGQTHGDWLRRSLRFLKPNGRFLAIHRAEVLPDLLAAAEGRLGGVLVRPVHARLNSPAIRILFGGTVGSRAPLSLLPPLVLHDADNGFTAEAAALHHGEAMDFWPAKSRPRRTGSLIDDQSAQ